MPLKLLPHDCPTIVIDTETTGLSFENDRIISFGAVTIVNNAIVSEVEYFINPGNVPIAPEALAVHGITVEFLRDKPSIKEILPLIIGMLHEAVVAGHHVAFDIKMLDAECRRVGFKPLSKYFKDTLDSQTMSKERYPGKKNTLDALCDRAGVSRKDRTKHGALVDARLCALAIMAMGREQLSMFGDAPAADPSTQATAATASIEPSAAMIILCATDEECALHADYLTRLEKENGVTSIYNRLTADAEAKTTALPDPAGSVSPAGLAHLNRAVRAATTFSEDASADDANDEIDEDATAPSAA